ncbi:MAG: hypothetical protein ACNI27_12430 [Desulfovibrio sp.]
MDLKDIDRSKITDLSEITCGLVPLILAHLDKQTDERVVVAVRSGIQSELTNGFGTGGDWDMQIVIDLSYTLLVFDRVKRTKLKELDLNYLEF